MSTARHQLAGAPGTGTTIDNMQSRVKAWIFYGQTASTDTTYSSFNISNYVDNGMGIAAIAFTAVFTNSNYSVSTSTAAICVANNYTPSNAATFANIRVYSVTNVPAPTDTLVGAQYCGTLA
jgi:hypothetical protein